jgi:hypothetical protein
VPHGHNIVGVHLQRRSVTRVGLEIGLEANRRSRKGAGAGAGGCINLHDRAVLAPPIQRVRDGGGMRKAVA